MSGLVKIFDAIGNIANVFKSIGELAITLVNLFTSFLSIMLEVFTPNKFHHFINSFSYIF